MNSMTNPIVEGRVTQIWTIAGQDPKVVGRNYYWTCSAAMALQSDLSSLPEPPLQDCLVQMTNSPRLRLPIYKMGIPTVPTLLGWWEDHTCEVTMEC